MVALMWLGISVALYIGLGRFTYARLTALNVPKPARRCLKDHRHDDFPHQCDKTLITQKDWRIFWSFLNPIVGPGLLLVWLLTAGQKETPEEMTMRREKLEKEIKEAESELRKAESAQKATLGEKQKERDAFLQGLRKAMR